jgi:hypothetical protein
MAAVLPSAAVAWRMALARACLAPAQIEGGCLGGRGARRPQRSRRARPQGQRNDLALAGAPESPLDRLDDDVVAMRAAMAEASRIVLGGFELGTDVSIIRWPGRYMDSRGRVMWDRVMGLLERAELRQTA